jgi:hypothetical protein
MRCERCKEPVIEIDYYSEKRVLHGVQLLARDAKRIHSGSLG